MTNDETKRKAKSKTKKDDAEAPTESQDSHASTDSKVAADASPSVDDQAAADSHAPKDAEGGAGGLDDAMLPLLPLRDIVVFPHMVVPLFVGREKSIAALNHVSANNKILILAAQKDAKVNEPTSEEIFRVGTEAKLVQMLRLQDGAVKVLVEGRRRVRIHEIHQSDASLVVQVEPLDDDATMSVELEATMRLVKATFENYAKLNKRIPAEMLVTLQTIDEPGHLADAIAAHLFLKLKDKQELLETFEVEKRLKSVHESMLREIEILQMEKRIRRQVKRQMERSQREYYLNEQMQAIQKELGGKDSPRGEMNELDERIRSKKLPAEAEERVRTELRKLKMMPPMSAEATVVRNYIDWILDIPWRERSDDKLDISEAARILDEDHYGLKKPKTRILEYLAVQALVGTVKGPILCLVGPPGVGKTSLGKSVARSTGRQFVRISLGGVRDEAEIRGHRRTYIGAMPGKIIQGMKRAGTTNPVFLLDEIDKLASDFRGDPASALLEVLDPEQNGTFQDHYLDLDYDLSHVLFITTANSMHSIQPALRDRMEIIELPGYSEWDKAAIAKHFLVPKQMETNGLKDLSVQFTESAVRSLINYYTKEAGVRNLEREIASICRKIAKTAVSRKRAKSFKVDPKAIIAYLGPHRFRIGLPEEQSEIGLTYGLAVTSYGGDLLPTEVAVLPGKGKLVLTGQLGNVMQESAQAAISYVRSRVEHLGLTWDFYQKVDIHIHLPEGAIPKDGPSAGITMASSIVSALCRIPIRKDVAMTGEITLRGRVLPIGGLKEKLLAAHRARVKTVIIPQENLKDLEDVPKRVMKALEIKPVEHMDDVLRAALDMNPNDALLLLRQPSHPVDWRTVLSNKTDCGEEKVSPQAQVEPVPTRH